MLTKLSKLWRLIATGICVFLFSAGGFVLSYIYLPLLMLIIKEKHKRKIYTQYAIYATFRVFIGIVHHLWVIRFEFKDMDILQQDKGCLFVANHPTLVDYVAIVSKLPRCENMVKKDLWENFYYKHVIQMAGYIPNINPEQTFADITETFVQRNNLLMFPEGTRSIPGQPIDIKRGAAQLSLRAGADIRLIHIHCEPATLTKQMKWYSIPDKVPRMCIAVGEKISSGKFLADADNLPSLAARKLTRYLKKKLSQGIM